MTTAAIVGLILGILVFASAVYVVRRSRVRRTVDNTSRPGQPEPHGNELRGRGRG